MGHLSVDLVNSALESYDKGIMLRPQIFEGSEKLRFLQIEVTDFATELIARYPLPNCDKSQVTTMAKTVKEMIELSVTSLEKLDKNASQKLYMMDDSVDSIFRNYLKKAITQTKKRNFEPRCYVSALLILRYLEIISDHACYI